LLDAFARAWFKLTHATWLQRALYRPECPARFDMAGTIPPINHSLIGVAAIPTQGRCWLSGLCAELVATALAVGLHYRGRKRGGMRRRTAHWPPRIVGVNQPSTGPVLAVLAGIQSVFNALRG